MSPKLYIYLFLSPCALGTVPSHPLKSASTLCCSLVQYPHPQTLVDSVFKYLVSSNYAVLTVNSPFPKAIRPRLCNLQACHLQCLNKIDLKYDNPVINLIIALHRRHQQQCYFNVHFRVLGFVINNFLQFHQEKFI